MTKALRKFELLLGEAWRTDQSYLAMNNEKTVAWSKADRAKAELVKLIEQLELHGKITS